jgi:HEAT repeat protein
LALLDTAESDVLCGLCDDYWNSFQPGRREAIGEDVFVIRHSGVVVHAINLLSRRGSEILEWALARLRHPDYDAREHAAYLLGELAERGHLGEQLATVTEELAALVTRPWEEDTKEVQANTSALLSLAKIGGPILIATLRRILTSDKWDGDDLQWSAAEILSQVAGKPIMQEEAPLKAAKEWMAANP